MQRENLRHKFETMLTGGHPNSLGRTEDVVDIVVLDKTALADLFECYSSPDAVVRLRVSSAFKRVFRQHPPWFVDYVDRLQDLIPTLKQPSAEWTLAQLHFEFCDLMTEAQIAKANTISKHQLKNSNDWIVMIQTMVFLHKIAENDEAVRHWLLGEVNAIKNDKRKSVRKKATDIFKSLSGNNK